MGLQNYQKKNKKKKRNRAEISDTVELTPEEAILEYNITVAKERLKENLHNFRKFQRMQTEMETQVTEARKQYELL